MAEPNVRLRIDLSTGRSIGPGKIALLETLERTGSLAQAARDLGMSYRRAWLLVQSVNALTDRPAVTAVKGGAGGGGATLTADGRALIGAFHAVEAAARAAAQKHFKGLVPNPATPASDAAGIRRLSRPTDDVPPRRTRQSRPPA